jgi:hypothetical protein
LDKVQSDKMQLGQGAERQGAASYKVQLQTRCSLVPYMALSWRNVI